MAFEKVESRVDFPALERRVLRLWRQTEAFEKCRRRNLGKPRWSFLDGPITANNPMGVHHAWGRTYKDVFNRYFAATGHELRYQNGFDCQGLWVEIEVERQLGFSTKREIEEYGLDRFTQACKERVHKYAAIQTKQSERLGYWMDWNDSYFTMSDENNYTIWSFLKKCRELGYLYKGTDVMPWSGRAGSAYSHMELAEGRRLVTHTAVFVRFPLRGRDKEYLLVWTTTPWTLTANTGCALSADLNYVRLRARKDGAVYYLAEANLNHKRLDKEYREGFAGTPWPKEVPRLKTLDQLFKEQGGYDIEAMVPGSRLIGWTYDGPFDELPAQQQRGGYACPMDLIPPEQRDWPGGAEGHRVFDPGRNSKGEPYVVAGEGTGIVHSAPGCGDVDHVWGKTHGLVAIAPLDENGCFIEGFGGLTGMRATDPRTVDFILASLREKGLLFATERYPHVYPHCWRTGDELVFRLVSEWYISMDWREHIKDTARQVRWLPESMHGLERELDWLTSMRDWMISKKRFWGLALPIWECEKCGHFEVIGSREELRARATAGWAEFDGHSPHRPHVDRVTVACSSCGFDRISRVPDVGNPWLDAGIVAYSTTRYSSDRTYWEQWIPADLITECFPGQFRNWFYAILAMSTMMEMGKDDPRPPFRNLLGHALVLNEHRQAMHKSDGTAIWFEEAAEQIGVDTMRWMYCAQPPTTDLPFGLRHPETKVTVTGDDGETITHTVDGEPLCRVTSAPADDTRRRILIPLWNTYSFFCNYARLDGFDPTAPRIPVEERQDIDRWILSDLQLLIAFARERFEAYDLPPITQRIERFLDDLSAWYVRRNRRRFWREADPGDRDKQAAYQTLYDVLVTLAGLAAPMIPFVTEEMYQNLVARQVPGAPESIHLCDYPQADASRIDAALSERMAALLRIVSLARSARKEYKLKVRQPLAEMKVIPGNRAEQEAVDLFAEHIRDELNVKQVRTVGSAPDIVAMAVVPNMKTLGPRFGKDAAAAREAILLLDPQQVDTALAKGESVTLRVHGDTFALSREDLSVKRTYHEDWAGADDGATIVLLDRKVTPELRHEGIARDIVRNVQELRKNTGLNIEDRIRLALMTDSPEITAAIDRCADYIRSETLAVAISFTPLEQGVPAVRVEIDDESVSVSLVRA